MKEKNKKLKIEFWGMIIRSVILFNLRGDRKGGEGAPNPRKSQGHNRETSGTPHESLALPAHFTDLPLLSSLFSPSISLVSSGPFWQGCVSFFLFSIS
jgi:hypothetical protein